LKLVQEEDSLVKICCTIIVAHIADETLDKSEIIAEGGVRLIVDQLRDTSEDARLNAANALANLCEHDRELQSMVVSEGGVSALIAMLDGSRDVSREQACFVLKILSQNEDTYLDVIDNGGVPEMVRILDSGCEFCRSSASFVLANLSSFEQGCEAIFRTKATTKLL